MAVSHVCGCQTCGWLVDYCSSQSKIEKEREVKRERESERLRERTIDRSRAKE